MILNNAYHDTGCVDADAILARLSPWDRLAGWNCAFTSPAPLPASETLVTDSVRLMGRTCWSIKPNCGMWISKIFLLNCFLLDLLLFIVHSHGRWKTLSLDSHLLTFLRDGCSLSKLTKHLNPFHAVYWQWSRCLRGVRLRMAPYLFDALRKIKCSSGKCLHGFGDCAHSPRESLIIIHHAQGK